MINKFIYYFALTFCMGCNDRMSYLNENYSNLSRSVEILNSSDAIFDVGNIVNNRNCKGVRSLNGQSVTIFKDTTLTCDGQYVVYEEDVIKRDNINYSLYKELTNIIDSTSIDRISKENNSIWIRVHYDVDYSKNRLGSFIYVNDNLHINPKVPHGYILTHIDGPWYWAEYD